MMVSSNTNDSHVLNSAIESLQKKYAAHTFILYGSRADGSAGSASDYDIAAFGPVSSVLRDPSYVASAFIDAFVYPETVLDKPTIDYTKLLPGRVIRDRQGKGTKFIKCVEQLIQVPPAALPEDENLTRRVWVERMLQRIKRGDPESNFRRAWLLCDLLPYYFDFRQLWYFGPKKSIQWLKQHDELAYLAFTDAIAPGSTDADVAKFARLVLASGD